MAYHLEHRLQKMCSNWICETLRSDHSAHQTKFYEKHGIIKNNHDDKKTHGNIFHASIYNAIYVVAIMIKNAQETKFSCNFKIELPPSCLKKVCFPTLHPALIATLVLSVQLDHMWNLIFNIFP